MDICIYIYGYIYIWIYKPLSCKMAFSNQIGVFKKKGNAKGEGQGVPKKIVFFQI